jgi:hypothetical protein
VTEDLQRAEYWRDDKATRYQNDPNYRDGYNRGANDGYSRGRAEMAAKCTWLADLLDLTADGHRGHARDSEYRNGIAIGYNAAAERLRGLLAEVTR